MWKTHKKKVILDSWWLPGEYGMYAYVWDCFELKRNAVFWDILRYLETHIVQAAIRANLLLRSFWGKCPYFWDSLRSYLRTMNSNSTGATSISVPSWVSRIWRHDSPFRNAAQNAKILDIPGAHRYIYIYVYYYYCYYYCYYCYYYYYFIFINYIHIYYILYIIYQRHGGKNLCAKGFAPMAATPAMLLLKYAQALGQHDTTCSTCVTILQLVFNCVCIRKRQKLPT